MSIKSNAQRDYSRPLPKMENTIPTRWANDAGLSGKVKEMGKNEIYDYVRIPTTQTAIFPVTTAPPSRLADLSLSSSGVTTNETATSTLNPESESIYDDILWTPFHRIPASPPSKVETESRIFMEWMGITESEYGALSANYAPYHLFCLKNHLILRFHKELDPRISLQTPTMLRNEKMYVTISPYLGAQKVRLTPTQIKRYQAYIDFFTKDFNGTDQIPSKSYSTTCVVMPYMSIPTTNYQGPILGTQTEIPRSMDVDPTWIPEGWVRQILPFIQIDARLLSYFNNEGMLVDLATISDQLPLRDGGGNYVQIYEEVQMSIIQQLQQMYRQGYVWSPSPQLIQDWKLVSVFSTPILDEIDSNVITSTESVDTVTNQSQSEPPLYRPTWNRTDFATFHGSISAFLMDQMSDPYKIRFPLVNNYVVRHRGAVLAMELGLEYMSDPEGVVFSMIKTSKGERDSRMNYEIVSQIGDALSEIITTSVGSTLVIDVNRLGRLILYQAVMAKYIMKSVPKISSDAEKWDTIGYRTPASSYRFSSLLPYGVDVELIQERLLSASEARIVELDIEYQDTYLRYMSLFEAIERGFIIP